MVESSRAIRATERTVYVVDDDPSIRKTFERFGSVTPCAVETFESAEALLEHYESIRDRSVLVIDYRLPGMSGAQLYRRLRELGSTVPVVFITGHDDALTRASLEAIHAAGVFFKPLDFEALIALIQGLFDEERPHDCQGESREER